MWTYLFFQLAFQFPWAEQKPIYKQINTLIHIMAREKNVWWKAGDKKEKLDFLPNAELQSLTVQEVNFQIERKY